MQLVPGLTDRAAAPDDRRRALWFWAKPVQPVCVLVPYETLWGLDPSKLRDVHSAFEIFEANRTRIEKVASARFDERGADAGERHQGQPVITLRLDDFDRP